MYGCTWHYRVSPIDDLVHRIPHTTCRISRTLCGRYGSHQLPHPTPDCRRPRIRHFTRLSAYRPQNKSTKGSNAARKGSHTSRARATTTNCGARSVCCARPHCNTKHVLTADRQGLTPDIFWAHSARILGSERAALPALVRELVAQHAAAAAGGAAAHSQRTGGLTPVSRVRGRLVIGRAADLPVPPPHRLAGSDADTAYIVISEAAPAATSIAQSAPGENAAEAAATTVTVPAPRARDDAVSVLALRLPQGKRGQKLFLDSVLPQAVPFADAHLAQGRNVCVCCDSGRDASVGVVLTALQLLFDDHGEYVVPDQRASAGMS